MAHTVLIVEDNADNREIYCALLRHHGFVVLEAADGIEGVSMARTALPDLILMDVSLPRMDGWTAVETLKADARTASIPIIALTAHALPEDRTRSFAAGCDQYLAKPIEPRDVVREVMHWLSTGSEAQA